jgi:exopolyphosphatase/guanosine-5'-triphosphate,3'-diphosphate pyrophosphatase
VKPRFRASSAQSSPDARASVRERAVNASPASIRAVADIGSNSVHLLVAVTNGFRLGSIADESFPSELGGLVERRGEIGGKATNALLDVLGRFRSRALQLGASGLTVVATEPLRRAGDRTKVVKEITRRLGSAPVVLEHEEEGFLTVLGLLHPHERSTPFLVGDIGGGSTEVVRVTPGRDPIAQGVSIGSARLMSRINYSDPPKVREWRALREHAHMALSALAASDATRLVLVGGTATRLLKLVPETLLTHAVTPSDLRLMGERLASLSSGEISSAFAISERRARLLPAGLSILEALLQQTGVTSLHVDRGGIREGVIVAEALGGISWRGRLSELVRAQR